METNPVLEELPDEPSSDTQDEGESSVDDNFDNEFEKLASMAEEWRDYMAQSVSSGAEGFRSSREAKDKREFFFDSIAVQETLQQNLLGQLNQTALNASDRKAAELIVGNIDDIPFV